MPINNEEGITHVVFVALNVAKIYCPATVL